MVRRYLFPGVPRWRRWAAAGIGAWVSGIGERSGDSDNLITLYHGTDATSAANILQYGFSMQEAAKAGGGDQLWTTLNHADAHIFALAAKLDPDGTVVSFSLKQSVVAGLQQSGQITGGWFSLYISAERSTHRELGSS
jgi:hypothetical protein